MLEREHTANALAFFMIISHQREDFFMGFSEKKISKADPLITIKHFSHPLSYIFQEKEEHSMFSSNYLELSRI